MNGKITLHAMDGKTLEELVSKGEILMTCALCSKDCGIDDIAGLKGRQAICKDHSDYVWSKAMTGPEESND